MEVAMNHEVEKDWTTAAGLRAVCAIMRWSGQRRHRCGYVEVPKGHPLYGVGYADDIPQISQESVDNATLGAKSPILILTATCRSKEEGKVRRSPDILFDCHGGLTYSGGSGKYPVESEGWWFGFDCAHGGDEWIERPEGLSLGLELGVVRTQEYVEAECERLAKQIVEAFPL